MDGCDVRNDDDKGAKRVESGHSTEKCQEKGKNNSRSEEFEQNQCRKKCTHTHK